MSMNTSDFGPITVSMFRAPRGQAPAVVQEWGRKLTRPGHFILHIGGALRRETGQLEGWGVLLGHFGRKPRDAGIKDIPSEKVERLLSPLAHEGRIEIMKALVSGSAGATVLARRTGFRGGALYHHLRELQYAGYVEQSNRRYGLTKLGRQLLLTMLCLADKVVQDRPRDGLAVVRG